MANPPLDAFFAMQYGDDGAVGSSPFLDAVMLEELSAASGIVCGSNPPYAISDFVAIYPKFGSVTTVQTTTTAPTSPGTAVSVPVVSSAGFTVGDEVIIDPGSGQEIACVLSIPDSTHVELDDLGLAHNSGVALIDNESGYTGLLPEPALSAFIWLATSSVMFGRWRKSWRLGMALFIAHYATLYLQTESQPAVSAAQAGLAQGIKVAKSVGDVSVGIQPIANLEEFGAFNLTQYGIQFATIAKSMGMGAIFVS